MKINLSHDHLGASLKDLGKKWFAFRSMKFRNNVMGKTYYGAEATGRGWDKGLYMIFVRCVRD
jgi:hypothetical protein